MSRAQKKPLAVLLHGIRGSGKIMKLMEVSLKKEGYEALNISYESTSKPMEELVEDIRAALDKKGVTDYSRVDFVGHSMGGLLIRELLRDKAQRPANLGGVVMMGSPNAGSEAADRMKDWDLFKWIYGPAGQQLTTEFQRQAKDGLSVDYKLGIIASADNTGHYWVRELIPGENDGLVSVESTKLDGMDDHVKIEAPHSVMPLMPEVIRQVIHFLDKGKFDTEVVPLEQHIKKLFLK